MNILVIQHLEIETPALIGDILREHGCRPSFAHVYRGAPLPPDASNIAGAVIMGGPRSANDRDDYILAELDWLRDKLAAGLPMLGICLGAQMMARASGAAISRSPVRELGWYPVFPTSDSREDPLFSTLPEAGLHVFQWHGETFSLPASASLVATNPDVPQQAFRLGAGQYGLQFHVEVDADIIEQWIAAGESERTHLGEAGLATLRRETPQYLETMRAFCRRITQAWLQNLK